MHVNGCLVWYADGWWGSCVKAGEWHETVRQPELICSARGVIDAEIVYTRSQSFLFFFSTARVRASAFLHALACSCTSSSICTYTVCMPPCTHVTFLYVWLSVRLHTSSPPLPSPRPQPRFLTFQLRLAGALTLLICSPPCLPRYPISPSISLRVSRS